ncbi:DNA cytosine methyltransferase [Gordonia sp. DT218]|uniref:DNA cytosine methyltransferase n=1 Tax=Gordonia sp. DT218 TaxID=3416659 RepID=UPI003CE79005
MTFTDLQATSWGFTDPGYGLTMADLFAGLGGSSTGAIQRPGIKLVVAANHWQLAIDSHSANHPDAEHVCADISQYEPRLFPHTDLLWASPSCTKHSVAQGKKRADKQPDLFGETLPDEAAERSRATMWDVVRFAEYHAYEAVIVENVVEVTSWPPYRAWLAAMDSLGYEHQVIHNYGISRNVSVCPDRSLPDFDPTGG